jgi:hypothetical protein
VTAGPNDNEKATVESRWSSFLVDAQSQGRTHQVACKLDASLRNEKIKASLSNIISAQKRAVVKYDAFIAKTFVCRKMGDLGRQKFNEIMDNIASASQLPVVDGVTVDFPSRTCTSKDDSRATAT